MAKNTVLSTTERILAALLAAVWIGAGLLAIVLGGAAGRWLIVLPAALGVAYGLLWARVAVQGRKLTWPATLLPRRRRRPP